jgi:primosomal protein N' (replication factor Y) (superfamily II helicase)
MKPRPQIAEIAVVAPLTKTLSYRVPEALMGQVRVGLRLEVPLGRRNCVGYLLALADGETDGLKEIKRVLDVEPLFPAAMVPFFKRVADYYLCPPGYAVRTALPAGLSDAERAPAILQEQYYQATGQEGAPRGQVQRELLDYIRQREEVALTELREKFSAPHAPLKRLLEVGFLHQQVREKLRDPFLSWSVAEETPPQLSREQQRALEQLQPQLGDGEFHPWLLHGVTGSGKTEIYLRAIAKILQQGQTALVLVPEIALTPQLVGRFRARFRGPRERIAVLHSGLSAGERYDSWRAIARGDAEIVIGARSAVFAPLGKLGIIVVDEEHDPSYKQGEGFRYHGRDLALLRGQIEGASVVLGSATPALTSYQRALEQRTGLLELNSRAAERPLPEVDLIDMTGTPFGSILSERLQQSLTDNLAAGNQSLLLLNRRGFSPFLLCADCGQTFHCPNCEITLTYHRRERALRCHYCDYQQRPPETCPRCQGLQLDPEGVGTERLEAHLVELFPEARIARMDRDAMGHKDAHRKLVARVAAGEIDILVGTQMVAKGHDFPGVTLVGVVNADATLNFPDFRAAERTFSLLSQVAGRAGRGDAPGKVLIQTFAPEHYALEHVATHDYRAFFRAELDFRRELGYPPFGSLVNLVLAGNQQQLVEQTARMVANRFSSGAGRIEVLGPVPCLLPKLRGKWRQQILLKGADRGDLRRRLARLSEVEKTVPRGVSLSVDIDPVDMF